MSEPAITLYRLQACPFCERVVRVLEELGLPYQSRFVEPMHSKRDDVKRVSGARTVPVLVDERTGVTLAESDHVVSYLETTYGEGDGTEEPGERDDESAARVEEVASPAGAAEGGDS